MSNLLALPCPLLLQIAEDTIELREEGLSEEEIAILVESGRQAELDWKVSL